MVDRFFVVFIVTVLFLGFVVGIGMGERPSANTVPLFNPTHANACRVLHVIARTKRERVTAILACEHGGPDAWLGLVNVRSAVIAGESFGG